MLANPFKRKAAAPERIPSDEVISLHWLDDNAIFRNSILNLLMTFDGVLDPERLRQSLAQLASRRDGWRKLGARLRLNNLTFIEPKEKGKLEYHVPAQFGADRPAVTFSHVQYDQDAAGHPIASQLPRASTSPAIVADTRAFQPLMRHADGPKEIADWLCADIPQLALHVVSFNDTTLVGVTWPHTLLDATGQRDFLRSWSLILQGKEDQVKAPCGLTRDPLAGFGLRPQEPYKLADRLLTTAQKLVWISRFLWENAVYGDEERVVCIPAAYVQALRDTALLDLASQGADVGVQDKGYTHGHDPKKPFVSEGDVLCAWLVRMTACNQLRASSDKSMISVMLTTDIRAQLVEAGHLPPEKPYVSNAVMHIFSFLSLEELIARPLGEVAATIRKAMVELRTHGQTEAYVGMLRKSLVETGLPPLIGGATMQNVAFANWTKHDFFTLDFSGALAHNDTASPKGGEHGIREHTSPTTPKYIQYLPAKGNNPRNCWCIFGKDAQGNYWVSGVLAKGVWGRIASPSKGLDLRIRQGIFNRASL